MHRMSSDGESAFLGVIKNVWFCFIAVRQAESNLDSQKRVAGFGRLPEVLLQLLLLGSFIFPNSRSFSRSHR
ncbi:hypothetical protein MLD38_015496 [Melastoma candidum]|uniref:Uncharacterized protein n=1 Tax=Melastoma candidum TaxID=119954 RepID=A0ACB9RGW5_9MYRT|nr:hypothetical protein MLD38_015496 [Melastoma candidum]